MSLKNFSFENNKLKMIRFLGICNEMKRKMMSWNFLFDYVVMSFWKRLPSATGVGSQNWSESVTVFINN